MAHEELPIPIFTSLEPVYGEGSLLDEAQIRFDNLKSKFVQVFGHQPQVFARSPGSSSSSSSCFEFLLVLASFFVWWVRSLLEICWFIVIGLDLLKRLNFSCILWFVLIVGYGGKGTVLILYIECSDLDFACCSKIKRSDLDVVFWFIFLVFFFWFAVGDGVEKTIFFFFMQDVVNLIFRYRAKSKASDLDMLILVSFSFLFWKIGRLFFWWLDLVLQFNRRSKSSMLILIFPYTFTVECGEKWIFFPL